MPDHPFSTDGCSGGMSWFWRTFFRSPPPWEGACVEHDRAYYIGGSWQARRQADINLAAAVTAHGYPLMAALMYYAVRIGGHPWFRTSWRWGYGWKYPQGYKR